MKKVVIFASCQSAAIGMTLMESEGFCDAYYLVNVPPVQAIKSESQISDLLDSVRTADVFIYQQVNNASWPDSLKSDFLLGETASECQTISIPTIYFDGYFPHLGTMAGLQGPLNLVHDYCIASGFVLGMTSSEIQAMILSPDFYHNELCLGLVEKSLSNLRAREESQNISIKISNYIEVNFKKIKLFNQFNHPRRQLLEYVTDQVLVTLGLPENEYVNKEGYLDVIRTPIYPSISKILGLKFTDAFEYHNEKGVQTIENIIDSFISLYAELGKDKVISNINTNKPFTLALVENYCSGNKP